MDAKTTWATTALAAGAGLIGALGGAYLGAGAALQAAQQQSEAARLDRLAAERTEANLQMLDAVEELKTSWSRYKTSYPDEDPTDEYWLTYVLPRSQDLSVSLTDFYQAISHSRAYGSDAAADITNDLIDCSNGLLTSGAGQWGGRLPPTDEQWETASQCFRDGTGALISVIQTETTPVDEDTGQEADSTSVTEEGCGFFWCPFG